MLINKIKDNTIIDAGHYSYQVGPTEFDTYLWEEGIKLYTKAKKDYLNIGLMLLVDDMKGVASNQERRKLKINELPKIYLKILKRYNVNPEEVNIISQDRLREKGRNILRKQGLSRLYPPCRLIVAMAVRYKEKKGYTNSINFYDEEKTSKGIVLKFGTVFSRTFLKTTIESHYLIFKNKENYKHMYFSRLCFPQKTPFMNLESS